MTTSPPDSRTVDDLASAVTRALDVLRTSPDPVATPSDDEAASWIREVYTDTRGPLRPRRSMAKGSSREARALAGMLRWHGSGGSLEGLMIARINAGARREEVDTLAIVLRLTTHGTTPAVNAWERTGLFS